MTKESKFYAPDNIAEIILEKLTVSQAHISQIFNEKVFDWMDKYKETEFDISMDYDKAKNIVYIKRDERAITLAIIDKLGNILIQFASIEKHIQESFYHEVGDIDWEKVVRDFFTIYI